MMHCLTSSSMQGFLVFDHVKDFPRAFKDLSQWVSEGKIQTKETIIKGGMDQAEKALFDVYHGINTGEPEMCSLSRSA